MAVQKGVGKCEEHHLGSYGYPTRPENPYPYCPQCGHAMVWSCPRCEAALPEDSTELATAKFCRHCGASYFTDPRPELVP